MSFKKLNKIIVIFFSLFFMSEARAHTCPDSIQFTKFVPWRGNPQCAMITTAQYGAIQKGLSCKLSLNSINPHVAAGACVIEGCMTPGNFPGIINKPLFRQSKSSTCANHNKTCYYYNTNNYSWLSIVFINVC